jgi:hypothetical protein
MVHVSVLDPNQKEITLHCHHHPHDALGHKKLNITTTTTTASQEMREW